jgi:hypothetical protein
MAKIGVGQASRFVAQNAVQLSVLELANVPRHFWSPIAVPPFADDTSLTAGAYDRTCLASTTRCRQVVDIHWIASSTFCLPNKFRTGSAKIALPFPINGSFQFGPHTGISHP